MIFTLSGLFLRLRVNNNEWAALVVVVLLHWINSMDHQNLLLTRNVIKKIIMRSYIIVKISDESCILIHLSIYLSRICPRPIPSEWRRAGREMRSWCRFWKMLRRPMITSHEELGARSDIRLSHATGILYMHGRKNMKDVTYWNKRTENAPCHRKLLIVIWWTLPWMTLTERFLLLFSLLEK